MQSVKIRDSQPYPTIGLLPFYIKLYDDSLPSLRHKVTPFIETISQALLDRKLLIENVPLCRLDFEFQKAIDYFEQRNVDAIVTLHLAYSPSLESIDALAATSLPLIILDTTPTYEFSPCQDPDEILYNHGIHGVQDLCNMLVRRNKSFFIEVGHWQQSDVLDRIAEHVQSIFICKKYKTKRIGAIGKSFPGMGDIALPNEILPGSLGFEVIPGEFSRLWRIRDALQEFEVSNEMEENRLRFPASDINEETLLRAAISGLLLKKWIQDEYLSGFTINFLNVDKSTPFPCMPFLGICKAMENGLGYAGEGDVLTAALMSLILDICPDASFTEMFCPDWKNGGIFLSHMGEINLRLIKDKPILQEIDFPYTDVGSTVVPFGAFKAGQATLLNLAYVGKEQLRLLISPGQIIDSGENDRFGSSMRGWFKPDCILDDYLRQYSELGGTHHLVVAYQLNHRLLHMIGQRLGWQVIELNAKA